MNLPDRTLCREMKRKATWCARCSRIPNTVQDTGDNMKCPQSLWGTCVRKWPTVCNSFNKPNKVLVMFSWGTWIITLLYPTLRVGTQQWFPNWVKDHCSWEVHVAWSTKVAHTWSNSERSKHTQTHTQQPCCLLVKRGFFLASEREIDRKNLGTIKSQWLSIIQQFGPERHISKKKCKGDTVLTY